MSVVLAMWGAYLARWGGIEFLAISLCVTVPPPCPCMTGNFDGCRHCSVFLTGQWIFCIIINILNTVLKYCKYSISYYVVMYKHANVYKRYNIKIL